MTLGNLRHRRSLAGNATAIAVVVALRVLAFEPQSLAAQAPAAAPNAKANEPQHAAFRTIKPLDDVSDELRSRVRKDFLPRVVGTGVLGREKSIAVDCSSCIAFYDLSEPVLKPFRVVEAFVQNEHHYVDCDLDTMIEYGRTRVGDAPQPLHVRRLSKHKSFVFPPNHRGAESDRALSARGDVVALTGSARVVDEPRVDHFLEVYGLTDGKSLAMWRHDEGPPPGHRTIKEVRISRFGDYVLIRDGESINVDLDDRVVVWDWRRDHSVTLKKPDNVRKWHKFQFVDKDRILVCLCERRGADASNQSAVLAWDLATVELCGEATIPDLGEEYYSACGSVENIIAPILLLQGTRQATRFCTVDLVQNVCIPKSQNLDYPAIYEPTFVGPYCVSRRSNGRFEVFEVGVSLATSLHSGVLQSELDQALADMSRDGHETLVSLKKLLSAGDRAAGIIDEVFRQESIRTTDVPKELLKKLDDDDREVRRNAFVELQDLGSRVEPSVRQLLERGDLTSEVRQSLENYLRGVSVLDNQGRNDRRAQRLIWALDLINTPQARESLARIGQAQELPELIRTFAIRATYVDSDKKQGDTP